MAGQNHATRFSESFLQQAVDQAKNSFIAIDVEHLSFISPLGRVYDGEIVVADDGEKEVVFKGRELPQFVSSGSEDDPLKAVRNLPLADGAVSAELTVEFEQRNFSTSTLAEILREAPLATKRQERWAFLPPLEWTIVITVAWPAVRFAGAFIQELGAETARRVVKWVRRSSDASLEPDRDRLITLRFGIQPGRFIFAIIPIGRGQSGSEDLAERALETVSDVASFAGLQRERNVYPGLLRGAFIFDGTMWCFGWWTDGEAVYRTRWFDEHCPDPARFLGHALVPADIPVPEQDP
jgi:hypothetical protein